MRTTLLSKEDRAYQQGYADGIRHGEAERSAMLEYIELLNLRVSKVSVRRTPVFEPDPAA